MGAMPTIEAQRTLVKSPPELWAELSDPTSLARHLGEFGEIRIARVEAETRVEWEAESASGRVELKPSGWGTKVTLTVVRETPASLDMQPKPESEPIASAADPEPLTEPEAATEVPDAARPAAEAESPTDAAQPAAEAGPSTDGTKPAAEKSAQPQPTKRIRRLFARLFHRRHGPPGELEQSPAVEVEPTQADTTPERAPASAPEAEATPAPAPTPGAEESPLDLAAELAAELERLEATMAEQDAELLSAVLDRLGAAHHRPFSRG
jgi:hypothetical protein